MDMEQYISNLYGRAKNITKNTTTIYNKMEQSYIETDMLGVCLGACRLQVRDGMWFLRN